ncbi:hypothetical protein SDC9_169732 [bioreactor metagenome]|uniref:Uncharacterized protein n=1 Tax=bioreactor metagenome TaxID=1076179 RepID=A0A645G974_9ZZZZ
MCSGMEGSTTLWLDARAFNSTPTPAELKPILPMMPASVTMTMSGLGRFWVMRSKMQCSRTATRQSQFWASSVWPPLVRSGVMARAVQPSEVLSSIMPPWKTTSLRRLRAMMSGRGSPAPSATPFSSSMRSASYSLIFGMKVIA